MTTPKLRLVASLNISVPLLLGACATAVRGEPLGPGLSHRPGDQFITTRVYHGIPVLQKSFFWDGNGEVEDSGVGVHWGHFLDEQAALGLGTNFSNWWASGRDVQSAEIEGTLRFYPIRDWPLFVDGNGGFQLANDQIPPGGTVWNFSFGFGTGFELPLYPGTSGLLGVNYHHISNALGRENERNPSQNEVRFWIGLGWTF